VRQRVTTGIGLVLLVGIILALNFYRLPVVALSPGPAEDVLSRVKISGRTPVYESKGDLYLTSVGIDDDVRFYEALLDLANRDVQMLPRADLYPENESPQQIDRQNAVDMDTSKMNATVVALRELGYKLEPSHTQVQEVSSDAPAAGKLRVADEILRVDGHQVHDIEQVREAIAKHHPGDQVTVRVRRDRSDLDVTVGTRASGDDPGRAQIGVVLRELFDHLPVDVKIDTEGIGGPSAGLMFTLSIIDKLTKEDLTGGRRIAGTGEILLDGRVGRIGGIGEKLVAARRQGATVFLVPEGNCDEARHAAPAGLRLVKVASLQDALSYLRQQPATAHDSTC
jgi:PDZ domain-containing protein